MKRFRHLNVPSHWEHYWSKYPEGYTILEALLNWVNQVDSMVDNVNDWNEYLENFVETFDEKLRPHVRDFMQELVENGKLAEIINEEIFGDIQLELARLDNRITDEKEDIIQYVENELDSFIGIEVTPEHFTGSDREKLQAALDYAVSNNGSLRLSRMYDITGEPAIVLNKQDFKDRRPVIISGNGGGIIRNDEGYMFTGSTTDVGDVTFDNVKFNSVNGAGTVVFDCNKIIRTTTYHCHFRNVDTIYYVDDGRNYLQSMRSIGDTVIGGLGDLYSCVGAYDCHFIDSLIEVRPGNAFIQRKPHPEHMGNRNLYGVYFKGLVWEAIEGTAIRLGRVMKASVKDSYFEQNGKHIYMDDDAYINNFTAENNFSSLRDYGATEFIRWAGTVISGVSKDNFCSDGPVNDVSSVANYRFVRSINDTRAQNNALINRDSENGALLEETSNMFDAQHGTLFNGDVRTNFGLFRRLTKTLSSVSLSPGETKVQQVQFSESINRDDLVNIKMSVADNKYVGYNTDVFSSDRTQINVVLYNPNDVTVTVNAVKIYVLKAFTPGT